MQTKEEENWTQIITPQKSWFNLNLQELWQYRDLIGLFVRRDFVSIYKQTILGPLWHIIQPLFTTFVFYFIFNRVANLPTDGIPPILFYLSGVIVWTYFAECLNKTSTTFIDNSAIFGKVYFPRLTVPVSKVIVGLLTFGVQLGIFTIFYLYYLFQGKVGLPNMYVLVIPYLLILMALLGLGLGIIVSSMTIKYRDLRFLVTFGVQLAMYATPVIYPLSAIRNETIRYYLSLNPVAPLVEGFRFAVIGKGSFDLNFLAYSTGITILIFLFGVALFHRVEKTFMDTV
ncbi:MAG: ABC transporter permease [Microscillaceae bacterium]|jgi:lipopolysaccharide transport system permease protein|nr:ABC transporter permease [Microscillaceae bacterium]